MVAFAILYEEDSSLVGEYTSQFQLGAHSEYLQVLAELGIVGVHGLDVVGHRIFPLWVSCAKGG